MKNKIVRNGWVPVIFTVLIILLISPLSVSGEETGFTVTSPAFIEEGRIPSEYSCKGRDISPELNWVGLPEGCVSIAIVMDDPDAPKGTWIHWLIWNIDPKAGGIPKALDASSIGAVEGNNSWRKAKYGGPCPPSGIHRYKFKVYALSDKIDLETGSGKRKLMKAIKDITLAEFVLMGKFSK